MTSCIGILTYRRLSSLQTMMEGVQKYCAPYPTAIAEDCGQRDGTADFLQQGRRPMACKELMATEYVVPDDPTGVNYPNVQVFMGDRESGRGRQQQPYTSLVYDRNQGGTPVPVQ